MTRERDLTELDDALKTVEEDREAANKRVEAIEETIPNLQPKFTDEEMREIRWLLEERRRAKRR